MKVLDHVCGFYASYYCIFFQSRLVLSISLNTFFGREDVHQVRAGEELRALREYFTTAQRKGGVMLPFYVEYVIGEEGFDLNESGTCDCGGPTKRMLSTAWFQYWDNAGVSSTWQLMAYRLRMNLVLFKNFKLRWCTISIELLRPFE